MSIRLLNDPSSARAWCRELRQARPGATLGFVPTMGALHAGHLSLVQRSVAENDFTCVSIFVNPLQFDDPGDLARYPRDFEGDGRFLTRAGCSMAFTGTLEGFFPEAASPEEIVERDPGPPAIGLEGALRPGHFAGVATIVARLFDLVAPDRAYFGAKDFQQTLVVRHLARELGGPEIVVCATEREEDGLALSSRNVQLSDEARERALCLSRGLFAARAAWQAGERVGSTLEELMVRTIRGPGVELEYAAVRDPAHWAETGDRPLAQARGLVAARVGGVRLIDNLSLDGEEP